MTTTYFPEHRLHAPLHKLGHSFLPEGVLFDRRQDEIWNQIYAHLQPRSKISLRSLLPHLLGAVLGIALGGLIIYWIRHTSPSNPLAACVAACLKAEYTWVRFHRVMPVIPVFAFSKTFVPLLFVP